MGFAIELYFDPQTERALRNMRSGLTQSGVPAVLDELGDTPHISLAVVSQLQPRVLEPHLRQFALAQSAFVVELNGVGRFPGVVFLKPEPTPQLVKIHSEFHGVLVKLGIVPHAYYEPGKWVPHCTMAQDVPEKIMDHALEQARKNFVVLKGMIERVGLVQFRPVRPICNFPLATLAGTVH